MTDKSKADKTALTVQRVDDALVEPARRGARKVGVGVGKVASSSVIAFGAASASFGGLIMALTSGAVASIGAVVLAAGLTAIAFGAIGFFALGRADKIGDVRQVERRLLKMVRTEGRITDDAAAKRMGVPVEEVRAAAERFIRAGVLDVDVDPNDGADIYTPADSTTEALISASDAEELKSFDARIETEPLGRPRAQRADADDDETAKLEPAATEGWANAETTPTRRQNRAARAAELAAESVEAPATTEGWLKR